MQNKQLIRSFEFFANSFTSQFFHPPMNIAQNKIGNIILKINRIKKKIQQNSTVSCSNVYRRNENKKNLVQIYTRIFINEFDSNANV